MKKMFLFLGIIASALIFLGGDGLLPGLLLAAGGGLYDTDNAHFRRALSAKMSEVSWNRAIWSAFMGRIKGKQSPLNPVTDKFGMSNMNPTGRPIEVLEEFAAVQTVDLDIPVFYPLGGYGITGREVGTGKGQRAKIGNIKVEINTKMQVFNPIDHVMSKYSMNKPILQRKLLMRSFDYLSDWFARYFAYQPYLAFLEGASDNLTDPTYGRGVSKASHMNLYTAGSGGLTRVSFSNTKATYEAAVKTALNGLANSSDYWFSTTVLEDMIYHASHSHRIAKDRIGGEAVYCIVISDAAARQLQEETKWNDRHLHAAERSLARNPLFTGRIAGMYGGALLLVDDSVPSAYISGEPEYSNARSTTGDANGVCYGTEDSSGRPDYMDSPVDPGVRKPAILFGKSAIALGKIDEVGFEEEYSNFKNYHEVAASCTFGFKRADILDSDGYWGKSGDLRYECVSSLVAFTYSP